MLREDLKEKHSIIKDASIYCRDLAPVNKGDRYASVVQTINEWFLRNRISLNAPAAALIEDQDFRLLLTYNGSSEEACIVCSCAVRIQLTRLRDNFSMSNYYKHLQSKNCSMMKRKKNEVVNDESDSEDDGQTFDDVISVNVASATATRTSTSAIVVAAGNQANSSAERSKIVKSTSRSKRSRVL